MSPAVTWSPDGTSIAVCFKVSPVNFQKSTSQNLSFLPVLPPLDGEIQDSKFNFSVFLDSSAIQKACPKDSKRGD